MNTLADAAHAVSSVQLAAVAVREVNASMRNAGDLMRLATARITELEGQVRYLSRFHPDWATPNFCAVCTPAGIGYCRCERASNE